MAAAAARGIDGGAVAGRWQRRLVVGERASLALVLPLAEEDGAGGARGRREEPEQTIRPALFFIKRVRRALRRNCSP